MHDNLDSNLVWYKNLADSGQMFANGNSLVDSMMLGIPRACYPTEWSLDHLLYLVFTPQLAYNFNYLFLHVMAFIGMRLFLKNFVSSSPIIYNFVALSFAFLPFWPSGYLTVAGLPILCYAILKVIKNQAKTIHWLIIFCFPFFSSLLFGNLFSYPILFLFYTIGLYKKYWKFNFATLLPFIILFVVTIFTENRIVGLVLGGFESNRSKDIDNLAQFMNYKGIIGASIKAFLFSHYHFHANQIFIALLSLCFIAWKMMKKGLREIRFILAILFFILASSFIMLVLDNIDLKAILGKNFQRLNLRLWVLFPLLWYSVFALVLDQLKKQVKTIGFLSILQVLITMFMLFPKDYFGSRYAENIFANTYIHSKNEEQSYFNEYYKINDLQFLIQTNPNLINSYSATNGVNPEILQFNGIKTLEAYFSFYPNSKRELIKSIDYLERAKTSDNLDKHTNRNFLFNADKDSIPDWDFERLKQLNVKFLFSKGELKNSMIKLKLMNRIDELYLYQIK